jgi:hypothetical protein
MKSRGRIFSGESVRAIMEGRKTQTRRIIKPQPSPHHGITALFGTSPDGVAFGPAGVWPESGPDYPDGPEDERRCPAGVPGDRIWVRETWDNLDGYRTDEGVRDPIYAADYSNGHPVSMPMRKWRSPMLMPRWASRLELEVTSVRVERLHEITIADIVAEGVQYPVSTDDAPPGMCRPLIRMGGKHPVSDYLGLPLTDVMHGGIPPGETHERYLRAYFASGWDDLNHKRAPWASNPWVWVIEFRRVE